MSSANSAHIVSELAAVGHVQYNFTMETPYGLIIRLSQGSHEEDTLTIRCKTPPPADGNSAAATSGNDRPSSDRPGYKYRLFPDWGTTYLWYDTTWHGNPEDEYSVDDDDLHEHYGKPWNDAYDAWMSEHHDAFVKQECHLGSHEHPFPDMQERKSWVLRGMMLCVWLCLQSDTASVEYSPGAREFVFPREGLEEAVRLFMGEFDEYLD
ncbi:hypothetical protein F4778DRAFT_744481 [Xylariomycetidae sp. FL2044]|nr:hypothetical protein F4778DRAFT_744481 [Xylariomycetidae sp. FL2044]